MGTRELKTRLGKYLKAVRSGATLTVTDRGIPIARLSPLSGDDEGVDGALAAMEASGLLSRGAGRLPRVPAIRLRGPSVGATLDAERDDRV